MDKYLYTINVLPLSRNELLQVVAEKFPILSTISNRIVDVFLMFSRGCHRIDENSSSCSTSSGEITPNLELSTLKIGSSDRLISTRDLLKLCSRSSPSFSITSEGCAYFVFQNAVDLFCSHIANSEIRKNLILSIGSKLGINYIKCEYLSKEYKPEVSTEVINGIRVGRVDIERRSGNIIRNSKSLKRLPRAILSTETFRGDKRQKVSDELHFNIHDRTERSVINFSFTRLASCLLERIAVAISENEPVLLVGETGVGKTSAIQYLAYQTNHKLISINMNNQSDVCDLIGGYKPMDLIFAIAPLRSEFEYLFKQSFNVARNEKFLSNISVCYNQGDFAVLIRLMLKISEKILGKLPQSSNLYSLKNDQISERWNTLKLNLVRLSSQLKHTIGISFTYINGPLIQSIENGDWVLLDEINLASTETLECLSTILEPNGSITLLEKGDFKPVRRHPDFRIFACMNPSTDVGKKDLTTGIRNRFTEFFVDELTSESDLIILVGDYLKNIGIQITKVEAIVILYQKLRSMCKLELSDGLGNQPIYSLRTLCRALRACSGNHCGSVERNLYESFCLSFLTQLDPASYNIVLNLIQKSLLSNSKAILSQTIPKPDGDYIEFQSYWIQVFNLYLYFREK